jgi:ribonuclease HI
MSLDVRLNALIVSDSQYVVGCMTTWIGKYRRNDWVNPAGREVANRDLLEEANRGGERALAAGRSQL